MTANLEEFGKMLREYCGAKVEEEALYKEILDSADIIARRDYYRALNLLGDAFIYVSYAAACHAAGGTEEDAEDMVSYRFHECSHDRFHECSHDDDYY